MKTKTLTFACASPDCGARLVLPSPLPLGWTAAICAYGHACWVVRAVGKTVVMRRRDEPGSFTRDSSLRRSAQH